MVAQFALAGLGALGSIYGARQSSRAAKRALAEQRRQFDEQMAFERQRLAGSEARWSPLMERGARYLDRLDGLNGFGGPEQVAAARNAFAQDPGYEFRRAQGLRAIDASAASAGMFASGAAAMEAQQFGDGLAAEEYRAWYARQQDGADLYGQGAQGVDNAYTGASGAMGSARRGYADAAGNAAQQQGNAWQQGMQDIAGWAGWAYGQRPGQQRDQQPDNAWGYQPSTPQAPRAVGQARMPNWANPRPAARPRYI